MLEDAFDEFAGVFFGPDQGDDGGRGGSGEGEGELVRRLGGGAEGLAGGEVGHVYCCEVEGGGEGNGTDVVFDSGFGVEVVDFAEDAVGDWLVLALSSSTNSGNRLWETCFL